MGKETHEYSNGELTVVWKPKLCIHSGNRARGLPDVFKPRDVPWIQMANASTEEIEAQIGLCPSGALSCHRVEQDDD